MTKGEAIGTLYGILVDVKWQVEKDAINMAIDALRHEIHTETHECVSDTHDSDLISRADVLEGLKHSTAYLHDDIYTIVNRIPSAETTGALDDAIAKYVADGYMLPPSGDLISRADAVKAICGVCLEEHCETECIVPCTFMEALEAVPSAEAVQRWIPCSERLPEEGEYLLVCDEDGDIELGYYEDGNWYWLAEAISDYTTRYYGCVAWMPLPEPWKEENK